MTAAVQQHRFGVLPDGMPITQYTLTNGHGLVVRAMNYGATITGIDAPDRDGRPGDVVLGFDTLEGYRQNDAYSGATIGRVANRIGHGRFELGGREVLLARNNGPHHLHGGVRGFDKVVWGAAPLAATGVRFSLLSPDGDEGYPGTLEVTVEMTLSDANALVLEYTATTDRTTPVNLTNHAYFNLGGRADILDHELTLAAEQYTPVDATQLPTGSITPVQDTPFDFTHPATIGARFARLQGVPVGYDHNFVLPPGRDGSAVVARVVDRVTGRVLEVATSAPGVQLYTANHFDGRSHGKGGIAHGPHAGFTLEAQGFPDAVHQSAFPDILLHPGETYRQTTTYRFGVTGYRGL